MNLRIFGDKEPPLKAIVDRLLRGFLTFGPGFVYGRKIRQAICMRSVTISVVRVHRPNTPMDKVAGHRMDGIIQRSLEELVWNLHHLRRTGTLYGKVELLRICYYGRVHEMKITSPEDIPDNSTDPKKWDDHAWISERRA
ncbi:hypothetical protein MMC19_000602 [Ptychographa xylographoides]|nr:hypothetical protein [Ptychographa xylographoides]